MPELPEVETTLRGIEPFVSAQQITQLRVRQPALRWPVTDNIEALMQGQYIRSVTRRAKYLIFHLDHGSLLVHLGMSGSLRIVNNDQSWRKHDHIHMQLSNDRGLRYHDPRRFGCWLWTADYHPQLKDLGPEPLSAQFNGDWLYQRSRGRKLAVKPFIMTNSVVVGVGNIYASEALFRSGIRPDRAAARISSARYQRLAQHIKEVLAAAIDLGGTTLRDFVNTEGQPGYFQQTLDVYGRAGQHCNVCQGVLREIRLGQRSSVFCHNCQR
ncbi:MAG: bifunctional DNA-formamidopyrimidine glycosylase/DNA-(apurinic or apyrimidinic site) lyase [Porticoccaceae bacterium]